MDVMIDRDMNHLGRAAFRPGLFHRAGEIDPVEAQHDVAALQLAQRFLADEHAARHGVKFVIAGEAGANLEVREHGGAELFGKAHAVGPGLRIARHAARQDHRRLRTRQQAHRGIEADRIGTRRRNGLVTLHIRHRRAAGMFGFLHRRIEHDIDRAAGAVVEICMPRSSASPQPRRSR
jgi:hypothetical protein